MSDIYHPSPPTRRRPLTSALSPTRRGPGKEGVPTCARGWRRGLAGEEHTEGWWLARPPPTSGNPHLQPGPGPPPPSRDRACLRGQPLGRCVCASELLFLSAPPPATARHTARHQRPGVKRRSQRHIPGRKSTYPRLRPDRGREPGRGGVPRGWRGRESRRAPEFGVKVGSGGSMGEAEGEARSRCQAFTAMYPGVGASWAPLLPSGELSCVGRAS